MNEALEYTQARENTQKEWRRLALLGLCDDCPDHEACMTGYPCEVVKAAAKT